MISSNFLLILLISAPLFWTTFGNNDNDNDKHHRPAPHHSAEPPAASPPKTHRRFAHPAIPRLKCYVCDDLSANPSEHCTIKSRNRTSQPLPKSCGRKGVACYNGKFMKHGQIGKMNPETFVQKKCVDRVETNDVYRDGERPDVGICIYDDIIFREIPINGSEVTSGKVGYKTPEEVERLNYTIIDMAHICLCNDTNGCNSGRRLTSLTPRFVSGGAAIVAMIVVSKILCTI